MPRTEAWNLKQEFEGRPSIFILLGLVVGLTASSHPVNCVALLAAFGLRSPRGRWLCFAFFLIGAVLAPVVPARLDGREFVRGAGVVSSNVNTSSKLQTCTIDLPRGQFQLRVVGGPRLEFGDHLSVKGVATPLPASEQRVVRLLTVGTITCRSSDVEFLSDRSWWAKLAIEWRESFESAALHDLPPEIGNVVLATVFGVDDVPIEVANRLREGGAISVASISGLQVLLLSGALIAALSRLPILRGWQLAVLAAVLWLYCASVGFHPGVVRASLMTLVMLCAYLVRRESDLLSALSMSAVAELLWRPAWVYDFGFQLSFVVVASFALWLPHWQRSRGGSPLEYVKYAVSALALAFVSSAPLLAYQTGEIALGAPVAGFLITPAVPLLFEVSLGGWIVALLSPALAAFCFKWLAGPLAGWVLAVCDFALRLDWMTVRFPPYNSYVLVPVYALMLFGARVNARSFSGYGSRVKRA